MIISARYNKKPTPISKALESNRLRQPESLEIESINMNNRLVKPVNQVVELLVTGKYSDLENLPHGVRLTAREIANAVSDYGRKLIQPPQNGLKMMDVIEVKDANPKRWSIVMPLWSEEEGRSDLTLEMTAIDCGASVVIELDNIHVL